MFLANIQEILDRRRPKSKVAYRESCYNPKYLSKKAWSFSMTVFFFA